MAAFSRSLIQGLINPTYSAGLRRVAENIAAQPGRRRRQGMLTELLTPALDPMATPAQLRQSATQALSMGERDLALRLGGMASKASEAQKLKQMRSNLETAAIAKAGPNTEIASALKGADISTLRSYLMGQAEPFTLATGEVRFSGTGDVIAKGPEKTTTTTFGTTISEWIDPSDPNNILFRTVQPTNSSIPIEVGSNRPVTAEQLRGLAVKPKPRTSLSLSTGDKAQDAYAVAGAEGLAKQDLDAISGGETAANTLASIAEARLVLANVNQGKDILGFASEQRDVAKRAFAGLLGVLGVNESDAFYQNLVNQTSSADMVRTFTQEFVRPRMEATKGAITEMEFRTFMASVPNLLQTPGGYKKVLDYMERASTAQVLYTDHLRSNMSSEQAAQKAKKEWNAFSRAFPRGSLNSKAMTDLWSDFREKGFDKNAARFEFNSNNDSGERVSLTYGQIASIARKNKVAPAYYLASLFEERGAAYIPLGLR